MDKSELVEAIEFIKTCNAHDPGGVLRRFLPLYYVEITLQKQGLSGQALKDRMIKCFQRLLQKWGGSYPEHELTSTDLFWLAHIATHVGISDLLLTRVVKWAINEDYQGFTERVKGLNIPNLYPVGLASLLLCPTDKLAFPPGHLLWLARGVKDKGEWRKLGAERVIKDVTNLERIIKIFGIALMRREAQRDAKGDRRIDKEKLESLLAASSNPKKKRKYSINARLEVSGIVHKGYEYRDDQGNIVYDVVDNSIDRRDTDQDADQADTRLRLIEQLKPRELDLYNAELERLYAKKTRKQWYGADRAQKVTQRMKYLKVKYCKY